MPNLMTCTEEGSSIWQQLPDSVLYHIFSFLQPRQLLNCAQACKTWCRVAMDDYLWKDLLYTVWNIDHTIPRAPGKATWQSEFKRLYYHTPKVESEVLCEHRDQVLHVSFSHDGEMFATSSKDGFVKVWRSTYPASVKYYADMKEFTWKYTQFSQFNESDTHLLVSGVHFGSHSTSGEIAVFNLIGGFELQCRVLNKPYDIFGTWYNNSYLLSGNLYWLGHLTSCSVLWLNKASQALESEHESVVMRLYKFRNINASSIRTIMIAHCLEDSDSKPSNLDSSESRKRKGSEGVTIDGSETSHLECSWGKSRRHDKQHHSHKMQLFSDGGHQLQLLEIDEVDANDASGTIEYKMEYRNAESSLVAEQAHECSPPPPTELGDKCNNVADPANTQSETVEAGLSSSASQSLLDPLRIKISSSQSDSCLQQHRQRYRDLLLSPSSESTGSPSPGPLSPGASRYGSTASLQPPSGSTSSLHHNSTGDKYLIFTTGMKTYTPHQIGIKRIKSEEALQKINASTSTTPCKPDANPLDLGEEPEGPGNLGVGLPHGIDDPPVNVGQEEFDTVDQLIELHGHIIGMCLSPDHRYLYVNSRPWPQGYQIDDPLYPPPIAQEIDIHVIDLVTMHEVGTMHRAHKAYTPNDECFFIFLDVCDEYVASGAEDKHGYLWDRHYGVCLTRFPHQDVVNSVAFNPKDSEMLITSSDDHSLKIWRSRHKEKLVKAQSTVIEPSAFTNLLSASVSDRA